MDLNPFRFSERKLSELEFSRLRIKYELVRQRAQKVRPQKNVA